MNEFMKNKMMLIGGNDSSRNVLLVHMLTKEVEVVPICNSYYFEVILADYTTLIYPYIIYRTRETHDGDWTMYSFDFENRVTREISWRLKGIGSNVTIIQDTNKLAYYTEVLNDGRNVVCTFSYQDEEKYYKRALMPFNETNLPYNVAYDGDIYFAGDEPGYGSYGHTRRYNVVTNEQEILTRHYPGQENGMYKGDITIYRILGNDVYLDSVASPKIAFDYEGNAYRIYVSGGVAVISRYTGDNLTDQEIIGEFDAIVSSGYYHINYNPEGYLEMVAIKLGYGKGDEYHIVVFDLRVGEVSTNNKIKLSYLDIETRLIFCNYQTDLNPQVASIHIDNVKPYYTPFEDISCIYHVEVKTGTARVTLKLQDCDTEEILTSINKVNVISGAYSHIFSLTSEQKKQGKYRILAEITPT